MITRDDIYRAYDTIRRYLRAGTTRVIGVEPDGAPTLVRARAAGAPVEPIDRNRVAAERSRTVAQQREALLA